MKTSNMIGLVIAAVVIFCSIGATPSYANTIFSYSGTIFTGELDLSGSLSPNMANANIAPGILDFSFSDGSSIINNANYDSSHSAFSVWTDSTAQLTYWNFAIFSADDTIKYVITYDASGEFQKRQYCTSGDLFSKCVGLHTRYTTIPAQMTVSETPILPALPLFASGLAGLGLLGWAAKRRMAEPVVPA